MSIDLILIFLVLLAGFYMAWNIGANDVANAMGTAVGSGALTLMKAVIIAGILEFCGAFFLGSNVSETIQRGLVNPEIFQQDPQVLFYGMLSALISTAIWLQVASFFGWPVSTTHAIVGAILGFGTVVGGFGAVQWGEVGQIVSAWVISPALSGIFAFVIFSVIQKRILYTMNPILATKRLIPVLIGIVFFTFSLSAFFQGLGSMQLNFSIPMTLLLSLCIAILAMLISYIFIRRVKTPNTHSPFQSHHVISFNKAIKHLRRIKLSSKDERRDEVSRILKEVESLSEDVCEETKFHTRSSEYGVVEKMFISLQIISAAYVAFAHGANDVANAIGPIAACLEIIRKGALSTKTEIPLWLLGFGGVGIVVGLATWGWRVIETIGKKITELTPTRGFSAEFGAATTILVASKLGLPVSTTHCIVGAVLGVGLARGLGALNLRVLRDIVLSWIITIPSSALICIFFFYILKWIFLI